jgi:dihydroorotate dehydrogenase (NAD+) catalytic subunit
VALIVSLLGESEEDVAVMAQALDQAEGVAAIELNLSCPNLASPHTAEEERRRSLVAHDPATAAAVIRAARTRTQKPLIAKLSPDVTDLIPIAQAAERAGADALSISNTFVGMSLDSATRRSRLGTMTGGLSGPAIRPLAVYRVWYTAASVRVPIIGLGGVVHAEDAIEFFLAGAAAVAIGSANFANPNAPLRVLRGIERYCRANQISSLADLRGAIRR